MTLDWLGRFLNIPETLLPFGPGPGGAVIQGSAGEATIVSILGAVAAHEKKMGGTVRAAERCSAFRVVDDPRVCVAVACFLCC